MIIITILSKRNRISRESIQRIDLLLLALETIDLNGSETFFLISNRFNLNDVLPNKVTIWKLRNNNPMRKSFNNGNISIKEFEALIKLTSEMSKLLYPYIRQILQSRDDINKNSQPWNEFKDRYLELITERFNTNSMKVKKLLDPSYNDKIFTNIMLTLGLCISEDGYFKLRNILFSY